MRTPIPILIAAAFVAALANAQTVPVPGDLVHDLQALVAIPAVPGHEAGVARYLVDELKAYDPRVDDLGNVRITIGAGKPNRLIVAPVDEPGFVVSQITSDGYLRLQRLPQRANLPLFNLLHSAQPMLVARRDGSWATGAMAGLSVHLQPGRENPPDLNDIENLYVDVGATSAAQVASAGIEILAPVVIQRQPYQLANGELTGAAVGDRFGAAASLELLRRTDARKVSGSLTIAFVTQNWTGARGLIRLLNEVNPDELILVGRAMPTTTDPAPAANIVDSGVLVGLEKPDAAVGELGDQLHTLATSDNIKISSVVSGPLLPHSYLPQPRLPARTVHLDVPIHWPVTPGETVNAKDVASVVQLLSAYLTGTPAQVQLATMPALSTNAQSEATSQPTTVQALQRLVEAYGVSEHESAVRETVRALLPSWANPTTDKAGNLVLDWGKPGKAPDLVVVAHLDEIGYEVKAILPDGRLQLEDKGGGLLQYFEGHPALIHSSGGQQHAGVLALPDGWQKPGFQFKDERDPQVFADVGGANAEDVAKLGIKAGDFVTVPKKYQALLGTRALGRSFDDRVGCTALVEAAWALGPQLAGRHVTFLWSTGEELGLVGAAAYARELGNQGKSAKYVLAVDTFVSSDSPLESKRFADAELGDGFVIRAVDNSNIVPLKDVHRLRELAASHNIPAQYGVTGGGNDGSAFVPFGSIDVALGWPLRYSHSPAEVIDTRDVEALARAVELVARQW
jgi:putative aminopeptidase FrvX